MSIFYYEHATRHVVYLIQNMIHHKELDIAVEDIPEKVPIPSDVMDWAVYLTNEKTLLEYSHDTFMPLRPEETHTLLARMTDRFIIYVLAPTQEKLAKARQDFKDFPWAFPVLIPTTFYLESVMYSHVLQRLREQWEHADYVGTISYSAIEKLYDISAIYGTLHDARDKKADVAAFLYRGDSLVAAAEKWHPGFLRIWVGALRYLGFPTDQILSEQIPSFYCNYWAATPKVMKDYMQFVRVFVHTLDTLPVISDEVWNDCGYSARGPEIAKVPSEHCMRIWGVPYYPFHPFLLERLPCFFFHVTGKKIIASTC